MSEFQSDSSKIAARLKTLQRVSVSLISQKDKKQLLHDIVRHAMDLLQCDAGSLFLAVGDGMLSFEVGLNDTVDFDFKKVKIPVDRPGLATYAFQNASSFKLEDVYSIPDDMEGAEFDPLLDQSLGYRTKSAIVVPLVSTRGRVMGVVQLLNKKYELKMEWPLENEVLISKMPSFDESDLELIESFAAVAAASIENQSLYGQIENIFESFVKAAVIAIDSRDPGTRGHSDRVAQLTVELARAASEAGAVELEGLRFTETRLKELLWAGYLHDFGKIAVSEATLQKDKKLTLLQQMEIRSRIDEFQFVSEKEAFQMLKDSEVDQGRLELLDQRLQKKENQLRSAWEEIRLLAEPTVLEEEAGEQLVKLAQLEFRNSLGHMQALLTQEELDALGILKGCLTAEERKEIESHVTKSWEFLRGIPWGEELKDIPEIAYCHHEFLDGTGYPRGLTKEQIPIQSRIMTICDIFDALAASDRSYKPALPLEKTLSILESMAREGKLEMGLFELFKEKQIWTLIDHSYEESSVKAEDKSADKKAA